MESIPELQSIIIPRIQADSLIFTKSLETQCQSLIFGPLLQLQRESSTPVKTVVVLFDGVDECNNEHNEQSKLIRIVTNFIKTRAFPLIAFFGSRAENHLCSEFRSPKLTDILLQLSLDTDYQADEDIRHFLDDSFAEIKSTHPFGRDLRNRNWPAPADINEIMVKASGQFIYASVVLRFISAANQDPAHLLEIVRGLRPTGSLTPFAQLDALYRYIFSQVADIQSASLILAWQMFTLPSTLNNNKPLYRPDLANEGNGRGTIACRTMMTTTEIEVALSALTSVLTYPALYASNCLDYTNFQFLHASLPDFLQDSKRSQLYYIDRAKWCTELSILMLRRLIYTKPTKSGPWQDGSLKLGDASGAVPGAIAGSLS